MTYGKQVQDQLRPHARALRQMIPDVYKGFGALHDAALAEGALDSKTKELIALALAVGSQCDGCIAAHAHAAVRHGASLQEAAEAIGVNFLMNGGPATIYGPRAYSAVVEFVADRDGTDSAATAPSAPQPVHNHAHA
jgi:AhpD family alkylhydroperoxidase